MIENLIDKTHNMDCTEFMHLLPNKCVDLTVTSPPYDNLRKYDGFEFDFENIAKQLFRITKDGGVVVWVVADATINGSETGTSFKQALFFKECGFNLHDTMIWAKPNPMPHIKKNIYTPAFEYMFVLSIGKPKTANILTTGCKYAGKVIKTHTTNEESIRKPNINGVTLPTKPRRNVWEFVLAGTNHGHPAVFPFHLAQDHILSWSNAGDIVFDPFMGRGTTLVMAVKNGRHFMGCDISVDYCGISDALILKAKATKEAKGDI